MNDVKSKAKLIVENQCSLCIRASSISSPQHSSSQAPRKECCFLSHCAAYKRYLDDPSGIYFGVTVYRDQTFIDLQEKQSFEAVNGRVVLLATPCVTTRCSTL